MSVGAQRAIVMGGSIAGLFAARVLSEFYDEVLVIDRDEILGIREPRRGAPHTVHAHGLHARGHLIVEELFPGFTDELVADGVPTGDLGEMRWYFNARRLAPAHTGLVSVTAPRPVLESHVRARVAAIPNVEVRQECDVLTLLSTPDHDRVTGVRIQDRAPDSEPVDVLADLVVDATGRGSRLPAWLDQFGYARPQQDRVTMNLAYTTCHYRTQPEWFNGTQSINPVASPAYPRGAFFGQVGRDTCILSLTGILGDYPPTDPQGFLEFARTLPIPDIYQAIRTAEPLDNPTTFRFAASVRRRYEKLTRFPHRLLALGDAVCSFNPVYGQGMSVAAIEALTLRTHLRNHPAPNPLQFFADLARVIDTPWEISTTGDLDFPAVTGRRTLKTRIGNAYMARVQHAATQDPAVTNAFMRVAGLIDPPPALMQPRMLLRVLRPAPHPTTSPTAE